MDNFKLWFNVIRKEKGHLFILGLALVVSGWATGVWPICLAAIGPWTLIGLEVHKELKSKKGSNNAQSPEDIAIKGTKR